MSKGTEKPRLLHRFEVTVEPGQGTGLDDPAEVRSVIEEAFRDNGLDNSCRITVVEVLP